MSALNDLTGQRFGKLLVLGIDEEHRYTVGGKIQYQCKCDCGTICYKSKDSLLKPSQRPKACCVQCSTAIPNGTRFGKLVTICRIDGGQTKYQCHCDCGNDIIVVGTKLKNGTTKSCGCYRQERMSELGKANSEAAEITGQKFGKLTAIEPTNQRQNRSIIWKCQCECGNLHYASVSNLKDGSVTRCSMCKISSKGEEEIAQLLEQYQILFNREFTFEDCVFPDTGRRARFDFWVNNSYLIEFDGEQHYKEISNWGGKQTLLDTQKRDAYKNQWCKSNNIPLIRIPYNKLNSIELKDLQPNTSSFLIS